MSMFTTDVDLLRRAPRIFLDCAGEATDVIAASDGALSGTTLASASSDFATAEIDAGSVIIVAEEPLEVVSRQSATALTISRPRASDEADSIAPGDASEQSITIRSFARLRDQVESVTLRSLGVGEAFAGVTIEPQMILNPAGLTEYLAARSVAMAYARASSAEPTDAALTMLAQHTAREAESLRQGLMIRLDLDGDGEPDVARRLGVISLRRG